MTQAHVEVWGIVTVTQTIIVEINGVRKKQHHSYPVMAAFHNPWLVQHTMAVLSHPVDYTNILS
jgi:hypothetical protein